MATVIHIESTFRDRVLNPDPADFIVTSSQPSGQENVFSMRNPVTRQLPVYNMYFPYADGYSQNIDFGDGLIDNSSLRVGIASANPSQIVLMKDDMDAIFGNSASSQQHGLLQNLLLVLGDSQPYTLFRIAAYDSLTYTVTLDGTLPRDTDISSLTTCFLYNSSSVTSSRISLRATEDVPTYFNDLTFTLYDVTLDVSTTVVYSDGRFLAEGDNTFDGWSINDVYVFFLETPHALSSLLPFESGMYTSTSAHTIEFVQCSGCQLFGEYTLTADDGSEFRIRADQVDQQGKIVNYTFVDRGYDILSSAVHRTSNTLLPVLIECRVTHTWQCFLLQGKRTLPQNVIMTPLALTPLLDIDLTAFSADQVTYNVFPLTYESYDPLAVYQDYVPGLQSVTGSSFVYGSQQYRDENAMLVFVTPYGRDDLQKLTSSLYDNDWWTRVVLSTRIYDQYSALEMNRSTVHESTSCYEVQLQSLLLPNVRLNAAGVLTSFYPYVFLELSNTSSAFSHQTTTLYTNNTFGSSALFVVTISDVTSPTSSRFLNLYNSRYVRQIQLNPYEPLHFRVFLPNGQPFAPVTKDTLPPLPPNPMLQVSAVFSLRKM